MKKEVFLKIWQNSQENTCVGVSYNKVAGIRLSTPFLQNTSGRMLLHNDGLAIEVFSNRALGTRLPLF